MKKKYILKKNWEFQNIIFKKKQFVNQYLILYFQKSNDFQIGISIPKKFAIAVKRNYLKRQIKSILDNVEDINNIKYKVVLIIRKKYLNLTYIEKQKNIIDIIKKLK